MTGYINAKQRAHLIYKPLVPNFHVAISVNNLFNAMTLAGIRPKPVNGEVCKKWNLNVNSLSLSDVNCSKMGEK